MSTTDTTNPQFALAADFVNQTALPVFLTGKAGTGKTTFLKYIQQTTFKKTAVVAPTGVAAINAGGVTLHSFFRLPFGPFIPVLQGGWNSNAVNKHTLLSNAKPGRDKITLYQELELLIIDEVSMLRADMLDAVDTLLRHFRQRPGEPFGGLQVLFIGDLFQLPPVINTEEWALLQPHYKSPFFFDAQVLQQSPPVLIELKKIYRQNQADFINLLNNVRNNQVSAADLEQLHHYYQPGFEPAANEPYITLSTHNARADHINQSQLARLPGKPVAFRAAINGEFGEKAYPAEQELLLKPGAQVMFIKNDKGEDRRWYNGKIVTISRIEGNDIYVQLPELAEDLLLEKETWKNIRYQYNDAADKVEEDEVGSFEQYPIRLAWAITIHKSQGLTFEKAIIDAGASFAPGQVYVALSRLTQLEGLILLSRIGPQSIQTDERILDFASREQDETQLTALLKQHQEMFISGLLIKSFEWSKLTQAVQDFHNAFEHRLVPDKNEAAAWAAGLAQQLVQQQAVAEKFCRQLLQLQAVAAAEGYQRLHERVTAAKAYFAPLLQQAMAGVLEQLKVFKAKKRTKQYTKELRSLALLIDRKLLHLKQSAALAEGLHKGLDTTLLLQQAEEQKTVQADHLAAEPQVPKLPKGETKRISLAMFREGMAIADIAAQRGFVVSTIEGHLSGFIATGEVQLQEIVAADKVQAIEKALHENPGSPTAAIKELLGEAYSYGEIRAVQAHHIWLAQQGNTAADQHLTAPASLPPG